MQLRISRWERGLKDEIRAMCSIDRLTHKEYTDIEKAQSAACACDAHLTSWLCAILFYYACGCVPFFLRAWLSACSSTTLGCVLAPPLCLAVCLALLPVVTWLCALCAWLPLCLAVCLALLLVLMAGFVPPMLHLQSQAVPLDNRPLRDCLKKLLLSTLSRNCKFQASVFAKVSML